MNEKDVMGQLALTAAMSIAAHLDDHPRRRGNMKAAPGTKKHRKHRNRIKAIAKASRKRNRG